MIIELLKKFQNEEKSKTYRRVDEDHQLDIYVGIDDKNRKTLTLVSVGDILQYTSSQLIEVDMAKRMDNKVALSFHLCDSSMENAFLMFCADLIEASRNIRREDSLIFVLNRWNSWRTMFKNPTRDMLTDNEIRGLIGELLFLKDYMIKEYGPQKSIEAWMGTSKAHKDFEINDTWYEIKTVKENAITVKISSIEQLDDAVSGYLVVTYIEKTNSTNERLINLNSLVNELVSKINDYKLLFILFKKLNEARYSFDEEYNNFNYKFVKREHYVVTDAFPRLSKSDLPAGVVRASYEMLLDGIANYMVEGD